MSLNTKKYLLKLRILPLLIAVATLAFIVRIGDTVITYKSLSGSAIAETANANNVAAEAAGTQPSATALKSSEDAAAESSPHDISLPSMGSEKEEHSPVWDDAKDIDTEYSDIKQEMYKDLAERRRILDEREKKLSQREALLEAGQLELDRKYKELTGMRDEIQTLLKTQSEEESSRLASLVKIYTGMKAKDAARILNTLDMDILVEVVSKMPESKSAPIMAAMEPDRARALTTLLAEQKKLPTLQ